MLSRAVIVALAAAVLGPLLCADALCEEHLAAGEAGLRLRPSFPARVLGTHEVVPRVRSTLQADQVFQSVVVADPIDVMNDFVTLDWAPQMLAHHKPMLGHVAGGPLLEGVWVVRAEEIDVTVSRGKVAAFPVGVVWPFRHMPFDEGMIYPSRFKSPTSSSTHRCYFLSTATGAEHDTSPFLSLFNPYYNAFKTPVSRRI